MGGKSDIEKRATTSVGMPTKLVHWPYRMLFSLMYEAILLLLGRYCREDSC